VWGRQCIVRVMCGNGNGVCGGGVTLECVCAGVCAGKEGVVLCGKVGVCVVWCGGTGRLAMCEFVSPWKGCEWAR